MRNLTVPVVLVAILAAGCSESPLQPDRSPLSLSAASQADLRSALAAARRATARYHNTDKARADGYVQLPGCIAGPPEAGDMGHHFMKASAVDGTFDPEEPEFLVYAPRGTNGGLHLVALEYYVPDETPTEAEAPELEGERFHVLPEGHPLFPGYALHAWVWLENPNGMFADFNPRVSCT